MNQHRNHVPLPLLLVLAFLPGLSLQAETKFELAAPFTNNMILQRQAEVPV